MARRSAANNERHEHDGDAPSSVVSSARKFFSHEATASGDADAGVFLIRNAEASFLKSRVSDASTPAKGKFDEGSFCSSTTRREVKVSDDDDIDTDNDDEGTPPPPIPPPPPPPLSLSLFTCAGSDPGEDDEGCMAAFTKLSETLLGSSPRSAEGATIANTIENETQLTHDEPRRGGLSRGEP